MRLHKTALKAAVTGDKLVIELSLKDLHASVGATNRMLQQGNRKDPTGQAPLFRVTNGKRFLKQVLKFLLEDPCESAEKLPVRFSVVIMDALFECGRKKGTGVVELPWNATDADGLKPSHPRSKARRC